ncbi:MAG: nucleotidyltransferase domain-containing protein, partial [Treponemataceae bacterium]|nr:nucleotidyltransferase domain-containing protein [Treponemataceae bacterium]
MKSGKSWERSGMTYNLDKRVEDDIIRIAKKSNVKKVILFGSRARGTNSERSDIDLA